MRSVSTGCDDARARARSVDRLPLAELWRDGAAVAAVRGPAVGGARVRELLRSGAEFVVASVGEPLRWYGGGERFGVWKSELRARLVPPDRQRFRLEDDPGGRCYVATEWSRMAADSILVLERHH